MAPLVVFLFSDTLTFSFLKPLQKQKVLITQRAPVLGMKSARLICFELKDLGGGGDSLEEDNTKKNIKKKTVLIFQVIMC